MTDTTAPPIGRMEVKFSSDSIDQQTGKFSGYGAVFGNVDSYGDTIAPGAFKATLKEWAKEKKLPPMLLQHGGWMMTDTDALPVGKWLSMSEDSNGLHVEGQLLNLDTDLGTRIYGLMKAGVLDGMSIGYRPKKFTLGTKPEEPRRKLEEIDLIEVSLVTFPANGLARVAAVKAAANIKTIREFEAFLRDAGGFSHRAASAIARRGFTESSFRDESDSRKGAARSRDENAAQIAAHLRQTISYLSVR